MRILAVIAHPDDESVGLFALRDSIVAVALWNKIEKMPSHRVEELYRLAEEMGWKVDVDNFDSFVEEMITKKVIDTVAVPSMNSRHPAHLVVATTMFGTWLSSWRHNGIKLMFYDVEMNEPWIIPLPTFMANKKKEFLLKHYPSQKTLWLSDHRYWLFEGHVLVV